MAGLFCTCDELCFLSYQVCAAHTCSYILTTSGTFVSISANYELVQHLNTHKHSCMYAYCTCLNACTSTQVILYIELVVTCELIVV